MASSAVDLPLDNVIEQAKEEQNDDIGSKEQEVNTQEINIQENQDR